MNHVSIMNLWPSTGDLAVDVGENKDTVRKWRERGRIPPKKWSAVADAARKRKFAGVTVDAMAREAAGQAA